VALQRISASGPLIRFPPCYRVGNIGALMAECCCPFHCSYWCDFDLPAESGDCFAWFMSNLNPVQVDWNSGMGHWFWRDNAWPYTEYEISIERVSGVWSVILMRYCPSIGHKYVEWRGDGVSEADPSGAYPSIHASGDDSCPDFCTLPATGSLVVSVVEIP
jgi:hypothetical protein